MTVYLDLDGVMADFDGKFRQIYGKYPWEFEGCKAFDILTKDNEGKGFFESLPYMPRALDLWNEIRQYKPTILSATGDSIPTARDEKIAWVREHISEDAPIILETKGRDKHRHVVSENDILIDDRSKAIDPWIKAGGTGILYHEDRFDEIIEQIHTHMSSLNID